MEEGANLLATLPAARRWVLAIAPPDDAARLTERERQHLVQFRDTLRDALDPSNADQTAALDRFNSLLTAAGATPGLQPNCTVPFTLRTVTSPAGLATILDTVLTAAVDGTLRRLKICANPRCRWAYYDPSRNASARWCDMTTCGNRAKVSRYRQIRAHR